MRQTFRLKLWRVSRRFGMTLLIVQMLGMPARRPVLIGMKLWLRAMLPLLHFMLAACGL